VVDNAVKGAKKVKAVKRATKVKVANTMKDKKGSSKSQKGGYKKSRYNRPRQNKRRTRRV